MDQQKKTSKDRKEALVADEILNEATAMELGDTKEGFSLKKLIYYSFVVLASFLCVFHLYATYIGTVSLSRQRIVHLCGVIIIAILFDKHKRMNNTDKPVKIHEWALDIVMIGIACFSAIYMYVNDLRLHLFSGSPNLQIIIIGCALIAIVLLVTNRIMGIVMPIIAIVALLYVFFGHHLGGVLYHREYGLPRIAGAMLLAEDGILGVPLGVSAGTVILFVIFGSVLSVSGCGQTFIDLTFALFGRIRGGPAKVAVVSSALFGSINGSAIANVVTTGTFTIPLMKRTGYEARYAGAVEAVASTGGQIMPPVMGAAAFIMAQVLGVPYMSVVKAAVIPALLYFFMVFVSVDFMAIKQKMKPLTSEDLPNAWVVMKKTWFLLLPIAALIYFMVGLNLSANKSALYSIGICFVVCMFSKEHRITPKKAVQIFVDAGKGIISVAMACATAGVIIACLALTGLAVKLSSILIVLAGGNLYLLMLLTAIVGVILGMGLPTTGVYVILASLAAPALTRLGVTPMAAHMFVFYYGVIAVITPPVALASYAAAGLAGSKPGETGWNAVKLGLAGFLLPVMFILNPPILMDGAAAAIIQSTITSVIAIVLMSATLTGVYAYTIPGRALFGVSALLLLDGGTMTDIVGIVLAVVVFLVERRLHMRKEALQE